MVSSICCISTTIPMTCSRNVRGLTLVAKLRKARCIVCKCAVHIAWTSSPLTEGKLPLLPEDHKRRGPKQLGLVEDVARDGIKHLTGCRPCKVLHSLGTVLRVAAQPYLCSLAGDILIIQVYLSAGGFASTRLAGCFTSTRLPQLFGNLSEAA